MRLHIVGGFLGSGKTTAIARAAKLLAGRGLKVGVVTNDQGKSLVDTIFMDSAGAPRTEVTGGCFCCRYEDFTDRLAAFAAEERPDWIFAEAVGSCADVVATVVLPIAQAIRGASFGALGFTGAPTFSVLCDSRLLQRRLLGQPLPFSEDLTYLFDKQIAEAGLIVANKSDLVADNQAFRTLFEEKFPGRPWRMQSAKSDADILGWTTALDQAGAELAGRPEEVDYERYGRAEAGLAWADSEILLESAPENPGVELGAAFRSLFLALVARVKKEIGPAGHAKAFAGDARAGGKISIVSAGTDEGIRMELPEFHDSLPVLLNLRIEGSPERLEAVMRAGLAELGAKLGIAVTIRSMSVFSPSPPLVPAQRVGQTKA